MDNNEIASANVNNMADLLAKIDMIHAASKQWVEAEGGCDPELGKALRVRVHELMDDVINVGVSASEWDTLAAKFNEINALMRGRLDSDRDKIIKALNEAYDQS